VSKQSFHQQTERYLKEQNMEAQILLMVYNIRKDHPSMGLRDMYFKILPEGLGRDRFEQVCKTAGLSTEIKPNYRRTTDSSGVIRFDNLLTDLEITRSNQVWQSDITYYELLGRFYFLTFIIDSFTRVIVGYNVSKSLKLSIQHYRRFKWL
jgi:putative transposase